MKRKSKIIVALTMLCITLSITAICFSFAWYAFNPSYTIVLNTGKETLEAKTRFLLRTRGATEKDPHSWGTAQGNISTKVMTQTGEATGTNINTNTLDKNAGTLEVVFKNFKFDFFGGSSANAGQSVIPMNGVLDEKTMTWNVEYLTFMLFEVSLHNKFFESFIESDFKTTFTSTDTVLDGPEYNNLFTYHLFEDKPNDPIGEFNDPNITYVDSAKEIDGKRLSMIGDDQAPNQYQQQVRDELVKYAKDVTDAQQVTTNTVLAKPLTKYSQAQLDDYTVKGHPLFDGAAKKTIQPNPNKNPSDTANDYYSYSTAVGIGFNPEVLYKYLTKNKQSGKSPTITFKVQLHFVTSNIEF